MKIKIKTLTPLWTGDVNRKCTKLKETGSIGSLRWWYEALVRGLGGYACDPTCDEKCELKQDKFNKAIKSGKSVQEALDEQICPACQLFGCTGWKRKIKFEINDIKGSFGRDKGFSGNFTLVLEEIKPVREEEKWLLSKTFEIIEKYGSMGGRTTRKPQRNPMVGKDYGLIKIESIYIKSRIKKENVEEWLKENSKKLNKNNHEEWPNLKYFFFVTGNYLNRIQMNKIMREILWLAGKERTRESSRRSKRIFSFKTNNGRIWGYVKDGEMLKNAIDCLQTEFNISNIKKFKDVII